ncbi:MAG TPA: hypothetical protein VIM30_10410, partial [Candidatus Limnocylindrales bacterium]
PGSRHLDRLRVGLTAAEDHSETISGAAAMGIRETDARLLTGRLGHRMRQGCATIGVIRFA